MGIHAQISPGPRTGGKLETFIAKNRANHELYVSRMAGLGIRFPGHDDTVAPNFWASCARLSVDAAPIIQAMQHRNIQVRPVWIPLPQLAIYRRYPYVCRDDVSRQIWQRGIMLPSGPRLTTAQAERVVTDLRECLR